jgi:transcriptional regulator
MYIPKIFKKENSEQVIEFVKENSFATLISTDGERPFASHLPIEVISQDGDSYLIGHLSKANSQIDSFKGCQNVLVTFLGANHYISPKWYSRENVPTWNYIAVQISGEIELITENEALLRLLSFQIDKHEDSVKSNLKLNELTPDLLSKEIKGVIGFRINIKNIDVAYKLSQNRNTIDYLNIISELQKINSPSSNLIASEMLLEYNKNKTSDA